MLNNLTVLFVLVIAIGLLVAYHTMFDVIYFGKIGYQLIAEFLTAVLFSVIIVSIALNHWPFVSIPLVLIGIGLATSKGNKNYAIVGVALAIIIAILGIKSNMVNKEKEEDLKKQAEHVQEEVSDYREEEQYNDNASYSTGDTGSNNMDTHQDNATLNADENISDNVSSEDGNDEIIFYVEANGPVGGIDMRSGPGNGYDIIGDKIYNGTELDIYEVAADNAGIEWYRTYYYTEGWVSSAEVTEMGGESYSAMDDPDGYIMYYSDSSKLNENDISGLSAQELTYARNEIYARHGYIFSSDELNSYFKSKNWYTPDSNFDGTLKGVEQENVKFIKEYQEHNDLMYKPQ